MIEMRYKETCFCCKALEFYDISVFLYSPKQVREWLQETLAVQEVAKKAFILAIFNHKQHLKFGPVMKEFGFVVARKSTGKEGYERKPLYLYVRTQKEAV